MREAFGAVGPGAVLQVLETRDGRYRAKVDPVAIAEIRYGIGALAIGENEDIRADTAEQDIVAALPAQDVIALAADQRVIAFPGPDLVVAGKPEEGIGPAASRKNVVMGGALGVLDIDQPIAGGMATPTVPGPEPDGHPGGRSRVTGRVGPVLPAQRVAARAAFERVVAPVGPDIVVSRAAGDAVGAAIPDQPVVMVAAAEVFDTAQGIALRMAAGPVAGP